MRPDATPSGRRAAWLAAGAGLTLLPSVARASEGGETDSTLAVVALIGVVAGAYQLTHFVVGRLQRLFLVLAGFEYVVLGILLGPQVPLEIPAFSHLDDLMPVVALAVGWIGLLRGMEMSARGYSGRRLGGGRVVIVQALVAGGLTALAAYLAFVHQPGWLFHLGPDSENGMVGPRQLWMAIGVMGCTAAAGSVAPLELLERRYQIAADMRDRIRRMAMFSDLIAIVVFGVLVCIWHPFDPNASAQPSATEWIVVSVGLGVGLGVLFTPFLGQDDSENGRFLAMVGIIVLASGAAYFLDLSPLLVNLCLGAVLVNTADSGPQIRATLERTKQPMALVLLVFAGALWRPVDPIAGAAVSVGYIALRLVGKALGTRLAAFRSALRRDYYRGLIAHGEVSVAIAVSFRLVFHGPAVDLAYTAILASVLVSDLFAPRVLRGLLVDSGDIRGERESQPAPPVVAEPVDAEATEP